MVSREFPKMESGLAFGVVLVLVLVAGCLFVFVIPLCPELPGMGMGDFHMGTLVAGFSGFDMGVDEEEGGEGEEQVGKRQEQAMAPSMPCLSPRPDESDHVPP